MTELPRPQDHHGSSHDRSARERDVLRELHELTDRPRTGSAPARMEECEPAPGGLGTDSVGEADSPRRANGP